MSFLFFKVIFVIFMTNRLFCQWKFILKNLWAYYFGKDRGQQDRQILYKFLTLKVIVDFTVFLEKAIINYSFFQLIHVIKLFCWCFDVDVIDNLIDFMMCFWCVLLSVPHNFFNLKSMEDSTKTTWWQW